MTPRQQTLRGIVIALAVALASGVIALVVEFHAIAAGGNSTISEIVWSAWAAQPGAFVAVLLPLVFAAGFLAGHLLWQSKPVYNAARAGVSIDLAVPTALKLRAIAAQTDEPRLWVLTSHQRGVPSQWNADFLADFARDTRA